MLTTTIPAIERQLDFRASPERLWRAITEDGELSAWFGQGAHLDLRAGADSWFEWEGHGRVPVRDRGRRADDPARVALGRRGQVGRRGLDARRVPARAARRPAGRASTCASRASSGNQPLEQHRGLAVGARRARRTTSRPSRSRPGSGGRTPSRRRSSGSGARSASPPSSAPGGRASSDIEIRAGRTRAGWSGRARAAGSGCGIEAVEPPRYLCWTWTPSPEVPVAEAEQVLRTEWTLVPREDGGTDLHLFESGFTGPKDFGMDSGGWDGDVVPALRKHLGEAPDRRPYIRARPARFTAPAGRIRFAGRPTAPGPEPGRIPPTEGYVRAAADFSPFRLHLPRRVVIDRESACRPRNTPPRRI